MTYAMVDIHSASYSVPSAAVTLDIDDTSTSCMGISSLPCSMRTQPALGLDPRDQRCFQPIHVGARPGAGEAGPVKHGDLAASGNGAAAKQDAVGAGNPQPSAPSAATPPQIGFNASQKLVGRLLHQLGFSLQANRTTREGDQG